MIHSRRADFAILGLLLWSCLALNSYAAEATIASDELEIRDNGVMTIFSGHVILKQKPYEIHADRMARAKADASVKANGHVVGTWISAKGEKVRIEGDSAQYDPSAKTVEVWSGQQQVLVHVDGEKGEATFHGDRGWVYTLTPGKARLVGRVTGHVVPAGAS